MYSFYVLIRPKNISVSLVGLILFFQLLMQSCTPFKNYIDCDEYTDCPARLVCDADSLCVFPKETSAFPDFCPYTSQTPQEGDPAIGLLLPFFDPSQLHLFEGISLGVLSALQMVESVAGLQVPLIIGCDSQQGKKSLEFLEHWGVQTVIGPPSQNELSRIEDLNLQSDLVLLSSGIEKIDRSQKISDKLHLYSLKSSGYSSFEQKTQVGLYFLKSLILKAKFKGEVPNTFDVLMVLDKNDPEQNQQFEYLRTHGSMEYGSILFSASPRDQSRFQYFKEIILQGENPSPIHFIYFLNKASYLTDVVEYQAAIDEIYNSNLASSDERIIPQVIGFDISKGSLDQPDLQALQQEGMKFWSIESPQYSSFPTFSLTSSLTWNFASSSPVETILQEIFNFMTNSIPLSPFDYPYLSVSFESTILAILLDHYATKEGTSSLDQVKTFNMPRSDNPTQLSLTPSGLSDLPESLSNLEMMGPGGVLDLTQDVRLENVPHLLKCYTPFGFIAESIKEGEEGALNTVDDVLISDTLWDSCIFAN